MRSPLQRFRWTHVPSVTIDDDVTYRVSALYWNGGDELKERAKVEATIDVRSKTRPFLDVGFTRGFVSSQAYARRFNNNPKIIPPGNGPEFNFDTKPFEAAEVEYPWLGFEARRSMLGFLDEFVNDKDVFLDVFAYDFSNPEIRTRLQAFGSRLRIIIDDDGKHFPVGSDETNGENALKASAGEANVVRHHFWGLQHNKVLIAKRRVGAETKPFAVLTGSTNFSLRGLYIQANNVLLFRNEDVAALYARVFDAGFPKRDGFKDNPISQKWFELDFADAGKYAFCFSPHADPTLSMNRVANAIKDAKQSVFYAIAFRGAQTGPADLALDTIDPRKLVVLGVSDKPGSGGEPIDDATYVQAPGRGSVPLSPKALEAGMDKPFKTEWAGGAGMRMHHKFVICDFRTPDAVLFTGSSNLAAGGEEGNGDNLIEIRDPKVVVAYAVEAVSIFDHYLWRMRHERGKSNAGALDLSEPAATPEACWWFASFQDGDDKCRDRILFGG